MPLQDLTPQLRTRLSRMERAVGWFVLLAALLLILGFGYYVYQTASRKGWFLRKVTYQTCVSSGAGLKIGDPVKLMGFDVGEITAIIPNDPRAYYNITIQFRVKVNQYNYQGYIWSDSKVKVNSADLLGNRYLEIIKGVEGVPTVLQSTNHELLGILKGSRFIKERVEQLEDQGRSRSQALAMLNAEAKANPSEFYTNQFRDNIYFLVPRESPALADRLDRLVSQAEAALPNILRLTNQLATVLSNGAAMTANLGDVAAAARPVVSNIACITAQWNQRGALGDWLLPTNLNDKLDGTLTAASTNLVALAENLGRSLDNLAGITSNLNQQVQANTNMLSAISRTVVDADDLVQGLKHHWLFRSAFKHEFTNAPPPAPPHPLRSPKDRGNR